MWADDFISLRSWIVFLSSYFFIVSLLLLGICIREMEPCGVLTEAQCEKILQRCTGRKDFKIKSHSVNPLSSQLDGMLSEQYFLKIHYQIGDKESTIQLFFKVLSELNPVMFEVSKNIFAFEKESLYYETVIPLLKSKGLRGDYVPKCYFSEPYVIVLEDLSQRSLKGTAKSKTMDLQHCRKGLETLAKFHAEPILYELLKSVEFGRDYSLNDEFRDIIADKVFSEEENCATKFMRCSVKGLLFLIDLIPENGINKTEFKTSLQAILENLMTSQEHSSEFRSTLLHGDLWSNNFLFQYDTENNKITDCVLIDFQILKYGPPALDVLQFLFTNTSKSFRELHHNELLRHYYQFFSSLLAQRGFQAEEVLSENEFRKSCEACALPAKIQAIIDKSITFLSDDDHMEAMRNEETFSKYLFEDRGKYIVSGFNKNENYRDIMVEDIGELRDMIFAK